MRSDRRGFLGWLAMAPAAFLAALGLRRRRLRVFDLGGWRTEFRPEGVRDYRVAGVDWAKDPGKAFVVLSNENGWITDAYEASYQEIIDKQLNAMLSHTVWVGGVPRFRA